jgi:hypothetical protein
MSWRLVPETDPAFPKWLKRENLLHDFTRVLWVRDQCGCLEICLSGLKPQVQHRCDFQKVKMKENP